MIRNHATKREVVTSGVEFLKNELSGSQYNPLPIEKERELFEAYKNGSLNAMHTLVKANMRYAMHVAEKYKSDNVDYDELVANAMRGLVEAVSHFDGNRGVRFASYAGSYILKYVLGGLDKQFAHIDSTTSLDANYYRDEEDGVALADMIPYDKCAEDVFDAEGAFLVLYDVIHDLLNEREQFVICCQFGIGCEKLQVQEIAKLLGVTPECVRLAKNKALKILRNSIRVNDLRTAS